MESIRNEKTVREQYKTAANLQTRISIHAKYSVNKQGFGNWIFEQYNMKENDRILELGCGDGSMWKTHAIPTGASLLLTDFSEGMLDSAKANVPADKRITFGRVDIQNIPYPDDTFDIVIANMMLYHVPDLHKGLAEVKRVLKPGGQFCCATYGEHGITEYVQDLLADYGVKREGNKAFTLQNGADILGTHFDTVEKRLYEDRLEVTETGDLVDYVLSLTGMADFGSIVPRDGTAEDLFRILDAQKKNGIITVPKEYGMFIAQK